MSEQLSLPILSSLISSAEVSPAKIYLSQEKVLAWRGIAPVFGGRCCGLFAQFDPESLLWKTSQLSLIQGEVWEKFSGTWPPAGSIDVLSGIAYRHIPAGRSIDVTESLSVLSETLPTLTVNGNYNKASYNSKSGDGLIVALRKRGAMLPTLTTQDAENNGGPAQAKRHTPPLNSVFGGALNPRFCEGLMGFPENYTEQKG